MNCTLNPNETRTETRPNKVSFLTPLANIVETKEGYLLEAEMPGVSKEGLEITVTDGELVLVGHRSQPPVLGENLHRETRGWDYRRTFELDNSIDTAKISAKVENGLLTLQLPKAEGVKPRRIVVGE